MGPLGPLPWKVMGQILKSWDNDLAHHISEGLHGHSYTLTLSEHLAF